MTPFYIGNLYKNQLKSSRRNTILNIIIIIILFSIILIYLAEANFISTYSFKVDALKDRIRELEVNNQLLEIEFSKMNSMSNLDFWTEKLKLVKVAQADYLNIPITAVAAK